MRRSVLPCFLFLFILIGSCRQNEPVSETGFKTDGRLVSLVKKAELFKIQYSDSLYDVGKQIMDIGMATRDTAAQIQGKTYMARSRWTSGAHSEAMRLGMEALKEASESSQEQFIPEICAVIGNLHKEKFNYELALETVQKGRIAADKLRDTVGILYMQRLKAMFTRGWGMLRQDTALVNQGLLLHLEGLALAETSPRFEVDRIGYYNNIGQALVAKGALREAEYHLGKALSLLKKYKSPGSISYTYNWLANAEEERGHLPVALDLLQQALTSAQSVNRPFREMEIYSNISDLQQKMGLYKEALLTFQKYSSMRDSLKVLENVRQLSELQLKYDSDKKDQQIALLGSLNSLKTRQTTLAGLGFGIFFVLSLTMIYQYKTIKENNRQLNISNSRNKEQAENLKVLMKELHHRVKNNLQIVSSLLSLQSSRLTDPDTLQTLRAGQQRIEAMSLIHKSLYNNELINLVDMKEYIPNLVESIASSFGASGNNLDIRLEINIEKMDVDQALPIGLIINECVTNTFKHAFSEVKDPTLTLKLNHDQGYQLTIADNGKGMDLEKWQQPGASFGIKLVKVLSRQLEGTCSMKVGNGTHFELNFPALKESAA